ncbi:cell division protein FtsB [Piscinibacterium candidicorallinum]|uniref:Cell division protein FtsB n=1 Tax=Piscinibacterium candidicorallinum TaxID=1793872 RepID=A0ABV7H174_9BURK
MNRSRIITLALLMAVVLLQWPVWFGKGGWFKVWEREGELAKREDANAERRLRNAAIEADVRDLQTGTGAIEERARQELGMVRQGEVYVQILEGATPIPAVKPSPAPTDKAPAAPASVSGSPATATPAR